MQLYLQIRAQAALCAWALVLAATGVLARPAHARNLEPGRLFGAVHLGVGGRLPTALLASPAAAVLGAGGEYTLSRAGSIVVDASVGLGHTALALGAVGLRGRIHDVGLAVSPWAQVQFAAGSVLGALGSTLPWVGTRVGLGAEYMLTGNSQVGVAWVTNVGGTLADRPALYGTMQALVTVSYARPLPRRPAPNPLPAWGA